MKEGESGKLEWKTERSESGQVSIRIQMPNAELFARYISLPFPNVNFQGEKRVATEDGGLVCVKYDFGYEVGLIRPSPTK